jgi:hypothetical protein
VTGPDFDVFTPGPLGVPAKSATARCDVADLVRLGILLGLAQREISGTSKCES